MNQRRFFLLSTTVLAWVALSLLWLANQATTHEAYAAPAVRDRMNAPSGVTYVVTNTNDSGAGSLRQAILNANNNPGPDLITFNIVAFPPVQVFTISPLTPLPTIIDPVSIDGTTQPGLILQPCHIVLGHSCIVLHGSNIGASGIGLYISAGSSTVKGLVINGFGNAGIRLDTAGGNLIEGNYIGTNVTGTASLPNQFGVRIDNSSGNTIGGTTTGARNLISGNSYGVDIVGAMSTANIVEGNFIGTNINGTTALPNAVGVRVSDALSNTIGGTTPVARNLISGNSNGVILNGVATANTVEGNYIGTDVNGTAALSNHTGVEISAASGNTIGGTTAGARNLISGNSSEGIRIADGASENVVEGNYIGTDVNGAAALRNTFDGIDIVVGAHNNVIGGTMAGAGNIVSGNSGVGILIDGGGGPTTANVVQGNYIGTDATGMASIPNGPGILIADSSNNLVGGTAAGARNLISGNFLQGIGIGGSFTMSNTVQGNFIGTSVTGNNNLGNSGDGIFIYGTVSNTIIGGMASGTGNTIAFNGHNGIWIGSTISDTTTANTILHNSIFSNTLLGIDLSGDGVTPNDVGDADTGPNSLQNYPVLSSAVSFGGSLSAAGILTSTSNLTFTAEFFANGSCDASGNGEGERFIGSLLLTTDSNGNAPFNTILISSVPTGQFVTTTATDPDGNTSEFSRCVEVAAPLNVYLPLIEH